MLAMLYFTIISQRPDIICFNVSFVSVFAMRRRPLARKGRKLTKLIPAPPNKKVLRYVTQISMLLIAIWWIEMELRTANCINVIWCEVEVLCHGPFLNLKICLYIVLFLKVVWRILMSTFKLSLFSRYKFACKSIN